MKSGFEGTRWTKELLNQLIRAKLDKEHLGDPCIFCNTPHDEVKPGPCTGTLEAILTDEIIQRIKIQNDNWRNRYDVY